MDRKTNLPPSSGGVLLKGKRGKLLGHYYLPGGEYPRPVVLICHGIPGKERLFDFAVALREAMMDLVSYAPALAEKPVLTVAGTMDALLPLDQHCGRLNQAIESCGKGKLTAKIYETDHPFNMHRAEIRQDIIDFVKANVG